jgi:hypothetical protein
MRNTTTLLGFIKSVISGALAMIVLAIKRSHVTGRKIANKTSGKNHPVNNSFGDYKDHIIYERSGIERNLNEFENSVRVKMRSIKDDFETVFGIPFP